MEITLMAALKFIGAALSGGVVWKLWDYWLKGRAQFHTESLDDVKVGRELRDEMRSDLDEMRKRVDVLEQNLVCEREQRVKAELDNRVLQAKLDLLIRMTNELRAKLGLDAISADEILPLDA